MRPRLLMGLCFATLLLAGCSTGTQLPQSQDHVLDPSAPRAEVDDEHGGIAGRLTDDALLPIPGATLVLDDNTSTALTDDSGSFAFSLLTPGEHRVFADVAGYEPAALTIAVTAGEVAVAHVSLYARAANVSYAEVRSQNGMIGCSAAVWQPTNQAANNQPIGLCVLTETRFLTQWDLPSFRDVSGVWLETTWRSNQVAGHGLTTFWRVFEGTPAKVDKDMGWLRIYNGSSPLQGPIKPPEFDKYLSKSPKGHDLCEARGCFMNGMHYTFANTLNNAYPVDFAIQAQQAFEDHVTVFHGPEFPAQYSALPDA